MNLKKMMIGSALLMAACCMQAQTKAIAHRGFWKTPGSSQNSITSLLKADSIGCYGSEFDVWLTKDSKLVVNHDPVYKMRPMEYSKGDALTGLKLSNGENLPSLEQYLKVGKDHNTKLILELKALNQSRSGNSGYGEKNGIREPHGIYHFLIACHERVYPPGTCRHSGILSER